MTSFIIEAQVTLPVPELWKQDSECAFCQIINHAAHAYRVYEDNHVIAFLGEYTFLRTFIIISQGSICRYPTTSPWTHARRTKNPLFKSF